MYEAIWLRFRYVNRDRLRADAPPGGGESGMEGCGDDIETKKILGDGLSS
jgi:hypothetical protein